MSTTKESDGNIFVIIRGLGDEPVRLRLVEVLEKAVVVTGNDDQISMPFHLYRAYQFDDELYSKMRKAFESQQNDKLEALWGKAPPYSKAS